METTGQPSVASTLSGLRRVALMSLTLVLTFALAACGQKGPLRLPADTQLKTAPASAAPAASVPTR